MHSCVYHLSKHPRIAISHTAKQQFWRVREAISQSRHGSQSQRARLERWWRLIRSHAEDDSRDRGDPAFLLFAGQARSGHGYYVYGCGNPDCTQSGAFGRPIPKGRRAARLSGPAQDGEAAKLVDSGTATSSASALSKIDRREQERFGRSGAPVSSLSDFSRSAMDGPGSPACPDPSRACTRPTRRPAMGWPPPPWLPQANRSGRLRPSYPTRPYRQFHPESDHYQACRLNASGARFIPQPHPSHAAVLYRTGIAHRGYHPQSRTARLTGLSVCLCHTSRRQGGTAGIRSGGETSPQFKTSVPVAISAQAPIQSGGVTPK